MRRVWRGGNFAMDLPRESFQPRQTETHRGIARSTYCAKHGAAKLREALERLLRRIFFTSTRVRRFRRVSVDLKYVAQASACVLLNASYVGQRMADCSIVRSRQSELGKASQKHTRLKLVLRKR